MQQSHKAIRFGQQKKYPRLFANSSKVTFDVDWQENLMTQPWIDAFLALRFKGLIPTTFSQSYLLPEKEQCY